MVLDRFLLIFPALLWLQSLSYAGNVGADLPPPKCNRGLEHGQPAQRSVSKVIFDGFPWVFDPSLSQSCQNGFPIVRLMFLYEARASYAASAAQLGTHFGLIGARRSQKPEGNPSKLMLTHPKQPKKTTTSAKPRFSGPEVIIFGCLGKV